MSSPCPECKGTGFADGGRNIHDRCLVCDGERDDFDEFGEMAKVITDISVDTTNKFCTCFMRLNLKGLEHEPLCIKRRCDAIVSRHRTTP